MPDNPHIRVTEADGSEWVSAEAFDEVLAALTQAAIDLVTVSELTWDKRDPEATRFACAEASQLGSDASEAAQAVITKAEKMERT